MSNSIVNPHYSAEHCHICKSLDDDYIFDDNTGEWVKQCPDCLRRDMSGEEEWDDDDYDGLY